MPKSISIHPLDMFFTFQEMKDYVEFLGYTLYYPDKAFLKQMYKLKTSLISDKFKCWVKDKEGDIIGTLRSVFTFHVKRYMLSATLRMYVTPLNAEEKAFILKESRKE